MLFENRTEIFILVSIEKCFVHIICFSWQAEYILQHPQLLVPIYSVHRETGGKHMGECVYRAGMGIMSELLSPSFALKITVLRLLNPCVFGWAELHRKKLQTSINKQSSQTRHKWKEMDQNKVG